MKSSLESMEIERDFYYEKLRCVEIFCQKPEVKHLPMTKAILKILYTNDAKDPPEAETEANTEVAPNESMEAKER
ncbi:Microtubule-associated protein RP/EB family member 1C [Platanthera guangdongensis]|uniref:Microtubule-associated protein RP/EB family member 1C n=1 Tax=Platanthera guangdongensis TaxID=2320717 RepID=A0ABR2N5G3_9ASPA